MKRAAVREPYKLDLNDKFSDRIVLAKEIGIVGKPGHPDAVIAKLDILPVDRASLRYGCDANHA